MKKEEVNNGVSLFAQSEYLMDSDPLEEFFFFFLGDFMSEHLISKDLAQKIGSKDKKSALKNQLKELISIYSSQKTLSVLSVTDTNYTSIAKTIAQMVDAKECRIYLLKDNRMMLSGSSNNDAGHELCVDFEGNDYIFKDQTTYAPMRSVSGILGVIAVKTSDNKILQKEYLKLIIGIAKLFATSLKMQLMVDETNSLTADKDANMVDLQHVRAELTALIGDLCDYQQNFVQEMAKAVDRKGQYKVSHSENTANLARLICRELGLNEKTTATTVADSPSENLPKWQLVFAFFFKDMYLQNFSL